MERNTSFSGNLFQLNVCERGILLLLKNVGSVRKTLTFHRKTRIINREKVKNSMVLKK